MFRQIASNCFDETMRSGANYHLYTLNKEVHHLETCLAFNPCHRTAREILREQTDLAQAHYKSCTHGFDCARCLLGSK